jgi:2-dehydro-3-deoxyglucarate aldolase/4-hydroxy-2-oxoheptanedioate aldolase
MRRNHVKEMLADGQIPVGHMVVEFWTRGLAKLLEAAGFDFVIFDMEHSGASHTDLADQLAWAKATSLTAFVRPPATHYEYISRIMDAGAHGVLLPRVRDADEVKRVLHAVKYPPDGGRGISFGIAHDDYLSGDGSETIRTANADSMVIVQIETVTALAEIDEIMSLDGVDMAWPGQYDLSAAMGILGEFNHPRLSEAISAVVAACERAGKPAGIQPTSVDQAANWLADGFRCISFSEDVLVYRNACAEAVGAVRSLAGSARARAEEARSTADG